jgi:hypothetical protein
MSALITPTPTTLDKRQLWNLPTYATTTTSCTPVTLASGGILTLNSTTITFAADVTYQPNCMSTDSFFNSTISTIQGYHDPFYASSTVLIYVIATTTVISWFLLTLLTISPGSWFLLGRGRSSSWLPGGRSGSKSLAGRPYILSSNSRPWLQKVAALTVTVALTIASADTFKFAAQQYDQGYMNAREMRNRVVGSHEIRVMRVVSDVFIWLAQVQTLIRLFPRRKEKLIIKWFGFLLILLDTIFGCLNGFYINTRASPRDYRDAIPALSYLFELSLSLLYGAWVSYYVATKRRYAFFNTDMPSITVVALLSIVSMLIPVGFFVADIAVASVSGWGDFFRWVGAAAASVLVWEWVERIEILEREEKRDGILGREIFEEDEVADASSSSDPHSRRTSSTQSTDFGFGKTMIKLRTTKVGGFADRILKRQGRLTRRPRAEVFQLRSSTISESRPVNRRSQDTDMSMPRVHPHAQVTIDRNEDSSTPSTIYAVHYHPIVDSPAPLEPRNDEQDLEANNTTCTSEPHNSSVNSSAPLRPESKVVRTKRQLWPRYAMNPLFPFKRSKKSPPLEIKAAMSLNGVDEATIPPPSKVAAPRAQPPVSRRSLLGRLAATTSNIRPPREVNNDLTGSGNTTRNAKISTIPSAPTIIPAPPRGQTWSPEIMRHSPVNQGFHSSIDNNVLDGSTQYSRNQARARESPLQRSHNSPAAAATLGQDDLGAPEEEEEDTPRHDHHDREGADDESVQYEVSISGLEDELDEQRGRR